MAMTAEDFRSTFLHTWRKGSRWNNKFSDLVNAPLPDQEHKKLGLAKLRSPSQQPDGNLTKMVDEMDSGTNGACVDNSASANGTKIKFTDRTKGWMADSEVIAEEKQRVREHRAKIAKQPALTHFFLATFSDSS